MNSPSPATEHDFVVTEPGAGTAAPPTAPLGDPTTTQTALEPTQDPGWLLYYDGYNVLEESALEARFAFGNGFLGIRAARSVNRGPTWVPWLGYSRWASWPRCYVAGMFEYHRCQPWSLSPTGLARSPGRSASLTGGRFTILDDLEAIAV
jgi:hypothetical protein